MELSPAQRKLTFAVVVVALAALAVYLFVSRGSGAQAPAAAPPRQHPSAAPARPPAATPSAAAPAAAPGAAATQNAGIFQLVPFTPAGLSSAEKTADQFGAAYGTYSYTEPAAAYVATMQSLVSPRLGQQIAAAYETAGVAAARTSQKQVAQATAQVTALRAFGSNSLTFVLAVTQQVTATKNGGTKTASYAVTLTGGDTTWQVTDIELASAGQF